MSIHRYTLSNGAVRYRVRVKSHGRQVASQVFERKKDAEAWEQDQRRRLRLEVWIDPRRGRVPLDQVAKDWRISRSTLKRKSRDAEDVAWRLHIKPRFGHLPVASITTAEVSTWVGQLVTNGLAPSTAARYLRVLRSLLDYAVADGRIRHNAAAKVRPQRNGNTRQEPTFLTRDQLDRLHHACTGPYADIVLVLGLTGLRWGELAGLQVGDRIDVPGDGLRVQRAVLAATNGGGLYVDSLKGHRARTVPLVSDLTPIINHWSEGKKADDWLFSAPHGGPLNENNWKRAINWKDAITTTGTPRLRVHDLRHTCASIWIAAGADPKVVQRILGHASAAMTMDLYGHLIDHNLWTAAAQIETLGDTTGTFPRSQTSKDQSE